MTFINSTLSRLTMYRLMLYYLIFLVAIGTIFNGIDVAIEALFLVLICYLTNKLFAKIFKATTNYESFAITALILSLIIGPTTNLFFLTAAAGLTMGSKYIFALNKRHFFNPAAIAVVLSAVFLHQGASWWIGTNVMAIPILLGGLLVLKKIRRFTLVFSFLIAHFLLTSPNFNILFFVFVMLVEPLTSPPTQTLQIIYGVLVAILFFVYGKLGISFPLELALISGNLFSFFATPHFHFVLRLKSRTQLASNIVQFNFVPDKKFSYLPGQYLELTLPHKNPDSRGTRRFFTISSSPTENDIIITSKFAENGSSFKKALLNLKPGDEIIATNPAGEFVLTDKPLVFLAGGIGITPLRSMAKYLLDTGEKRDIILLYSAKTAPEFVYEDFFKILKTVYKVGQIDEELICREVLDYKNRIFYVSGPEFMVQHFEKLLAHMDLPHSQIKRDYFPGYAS